MPGSLVTEAMMRRRDLHRLARIPLALLPFAACADSPVAPLGPPSCTMVAGTGAVTFTLDAGQTLTPTEGQLTGVRYTRGLAALTGSRLLAAHAGTILVSEDAGCSWRSVGQLPASVTPLVAASPTHAYAWVENGTQLYRVGIDGTVEALSPPVQALIGVTVRQGGTELLRVAGERGEILESSDGGHTWQPSGTSPPTASLLIYSVAFDPANPDHAVAGTANTGAFVTFDGGRSWSRSTLASSTAVANQNVFTIAISPVDANVVWAAGVDVEESANHIYLSRDGGRTFTVALSEENGTGDGSPPRGGVHIVNGPLLAPHPASAGVVYFVFSLPFNSYGTDIIEYDATTGMHAVRHNDYLDVSAIAFAPNRPGTMYLGLGSVQTCEPPACIP